MGFPKVPTTWENMIVPNNLSITRDELPFLLKEIHIGEDRAEKVIIFSSAAQQNLLDKSDVWICDGTFDIAQQTMFTQVFIISAKSATGVFVPSLFALLPTKETAAYRLVFNAKRRLEYPHLHVSMLTLKKQLLMRFSQSLEKSQK